MTAKISKREENLYPEIEQWFNQYLAEKHKSCEIITTHKTSRITIDAYLRNLGIELKEAVGLLIKVDITGIVRKGKTVKLAFIEVKDNPLTLSDLGQIWGYTKLINPIESFLVSSEGVGMLDYILKVLRREDILRYGSKNEKMIKVAKWDTRRKAIDYRTLIPKL